MTKQELNKIIKSATSRRQTLIKRLHLAQSKQDNVKCDQIYFRLQAENELITNAQKTLKYTYA
jgi:hypothetical protein